MIKSHFSIYLLIGLFNTSIGYIVIFYLTYINVMPEVSNFIGYFIGVFSSYFINKKYNFKSNNKHKKELPKFLLSMLISYVINLLILIICYRVLDWNVYLSHALAGIAYTITGYLMSKYFVFQKGKK